MDLVDLTRAAGKELELRRELIRGEPADPLFSKGATSSWCNAAFLTHVAEVDSHGSAWSDEAPPLA